MTARDFERYLVPSSPDCPTFVDDTEWHPLLDGATYFPELYACLVEAGQGDTVFVAGLELDPDIDLLGRADDDPDREPLGELLARIAARGADVRVLLASRVIAASFPGSWLGGFRATAKNAHRMRRLRPKGSDPSAPPPLAGRVLLDYSGAPLGSNHQKSVVVHVGGRLTAFVGGIDLSADRFDATPHDRLTYAGERWGWHDIAVRLRGRGAERVWDALALRWQEATTLPSKRFLYRATELRRLNEPEVVPVPPPAPRGEQISNPGTSIRVLRSINDRKLYRVLRPRTPHKWDEVPDHGVQEIFGTLVAAISAARRFIYLEDQYLEEAAGGVAAFELYPYLFAAAIRGVKVVLVGSGTRDPDDPGWHPTPINRVVTTDLQTKLIDPLPPQWRTNVAVYRIENVTVHAKLVLIDDVFVSIGSANMFSRSMAGTDCEISVALATSTDLARDLRVQVWADHLRTEVTDEVRAKLADLDVALGIWRPEWAEGAPDDVWRRAGSPAGFAPRERALRLVGP